MNTTRQSGIDGMRALANWLERHPDVPFDGSALFNSFVSTRDEFQRLARCSDWEKGYLGDDWAYLRKTFADGRIQFDVNIGRGEVCERVVVGVETVPPVPERTVERVEWRCHSILAPESVR